MGAYPCRSPKANRRSAWQFFVKMIGPERSCNRRRSVQENGHPSVNNGSTLNYSNLFLEHQASIPKPVRGRGCTNRSGVQTTLHPQRLHLGMGQGLRWTPPNRPRAIISVPRSGKKAMRLQSIGSPFSSNEQRPRITAFTSSRLRRFQSVSLITFCESASARRAPKPKRPRRLRCGITLDRSCASCHEWSTSVGATRPTSERGPIRQQN